ncbi:Caspase-9 (apoptosis) inhibitor (mitochondrial-associated) [Raccoonpox virus]|uniref:Caspase-9 (Apoptosis) inhibitor (Mitochondrial-associated) n=1 Tax=Raccoon poxvirus TaxID=10256 RepID=A0A0G3FXK1_RACVI|nr:Caspase-9 (apoptosis) inhibitor (mitochondrial-associated) [Raccoonpox virus]AKJ93668.1 Caspase-9 (apoptosis) inhibitor (mitochondrial-associated) [Raccoonpox virus]
MDSMLSMFMCNNIVDMHDIHNDIDDIHNDIHDIDDNINDDIEDEGSDTDHNYEYPRPENMLYRFDQSTNMLDCLSERDHVMAAVQYYMSRQCLNDLYRRLPTKTRSYIDIINTHCGKINNDYASDMNIMYDMASTESFTVYDINNEVNTLLINNNGLGIRLATISFITILGRRCMNPVETMKMFTLLSHTICDDCFVDYIKDIARCGNITNNYTSLKLIGITVFMFVTYKTLKYIMG